MKNALIKAGFKLNIRYDVFDRGNYRVYFDDNLAYVVKFNDQKTQLIEWKSSIDMGMGESRALMVIGVMTK